MHVNAPPNHAAKMNGSPRLHSPDAELSVLGGIAGDPGAADRVFELLVEDDFHVEKHRRFFRAANHVRSRGEEIDPVTVGEELKRAGDFDLVGGRAFLVDVWEAVPSAENVDHHLRIVRRKSAFRRVQDALKEEDDAALRSAVEALDSTAPGRDRFRLLTDREVENLPPLEYQVDGVVPKNGLTVVYGPPGGGKTYFVLDLSGSVGTGLPWHGRAVERGLVVYVFAEGMSGLPGRIRAWKIARHYIGSDLGVYFLPAPVSLLDNGDMSGLLGAIRSLPEPPKLVVFDTLARCMGGGDENSTQDMNRVIESVDRVRHETGAAVTLVHHTNASGERERGNTALRGAADTMVQVKGDEDGRITVTCEKQKDAAPFERMHLRLLEVKESCVLVTASGAFAVSDGELTSSQVDVLRSLQRSALADGLTSTAWQNCSDVPERTFYAARKVLVERGFVESDKEGRGARYVVTEAGEEFLTATCNDTASLTACSDPKLLHATGGPFRDPVHCSNGQQGEQQEGAA